jgi:hypothetical protein
MFDLDVTHARSPQPNRFRFEGLEIRLDHDQSVAFSPTLISRLADWFARSRTPRDARRPSTRRATAAGK